MQDQEITSGSPETASDPRVVLEQVLMELASQLPVITAAGTIAVEAEVLPYALSSMRPYCSYRSRGEGEHQLRSSFAWRNLETREVYCDMRCVALDAIELAARIANEEQLVITGG